MNVGDRIFNPVLDSDGYVEVRSGRVVTCGGRIIAVLVGQDIHFWERDSCYSTVTEACAAMTQTTPTPADLRDLDGTT